MVISGDQLQTDRKEVKSGNSGLQHAMERLNGINGVGIVKFSENDIVTNPQEEGKDARTSIRSGRCFLSPDRCLLLRYQQAQRLSYDFAAAQTCAESVAHHCKAMNLSGKRGHIEKPGLSESRFLFILICSGLCADAGQGVTFGHRPKPVSSGRDRIH